MDPKEIHKIDEAMADMKGHFIPILWSFYNGCTNEGFDKEQAFRLTSTYMVCVLGKSPNEPPRSETEESE